MMDIARETGVSQSTVSRLLNNVALPVPITPDTRQRVLEAARRLNYTPNPLARALRGAPMMLIGAIVRDITDPFFLQGIDALSNEVKARGYNLVLGHAHSRAEEAMALREVLEARHCDAIVVLGDMQDQPRLIADLQECRIPVVALWQGTKLKGLPAVNVDNRAGVEAVVEHLIGLGHKRLGFITGRLMGDHRERQEAFIAAVERTGLRMPKRYLHSAPNSCAGGAMALQALFQISEPPTAVVAGNDQLAIGALHEANRRGLRVPQDVSITGFDDLPISAYTIPSLTTVRMPVSEIISAAVHIILDGPESGLPGPSSSEVVRPILIIRDSTGQAPRDRG
jgi:DNA-binding LacI/PurR family transcriptional regulator